MKTKITILGAGSWGTALALVLADNGNQVTIYSKNSKVCDEINQKHTNSNYFDEVFLLPTSIVATCDLSQAIQENQIILLSVPSSSVRSLVSSIIPLLKTKTLFINTAKGFDPTTNDRLSETIRRLVPKKFLLGVGP